MLDAPLWSILAACFAAALVAPALVRALGSTHGGQRAAWILALAPFSIFIALLMRVHDVNAGLPIVEDFAWAPTLGLNLTLRLDGLGLIFSTLISGIGTLIVLYAGAYLKGHPHLGRLYAALFIFMGAMLGIALSDNLLAIFVFWELTSISSYLLISFDHTRERARKAALQALLTTGIGGLALLAGIVLLGTATGQWTVSGLIAANTSIGSDSFHANSILSHPWYPAILILFIIAAATKSAQFPFHFWLPNAMEAPAPVSAYLHSSTMVKAGIFLLARFAPVLGPSAAHQSELATTGTPPNAHAWTITLVLMGCVTMLVGALLALRTTTTKKLLACTTISALGAIVLALGIGTPKAVEAALVFLCAHALYKGALFMLAGAIEHATHIKEVEHLGGLARSMPALAVAGLLAAASMAGLPPLVGFIGKELVLDSTLKDAAVNIGGSSHLINWVLAACITLAASVYVVVAILVGIRPFWGRVQKDHAHAPHAQAAVHLAHPRAHEPTHEPAHTASKQGMIGLILGPFILASLGLAAGFFPAAIIEPFTTPATNATLGDSVAKGQLHLWHGWTPALGLSGLAVTLGLVLYLFRHRLRVALKLLAALDAYGPDRLYSRVLAASIDAASWLTSTLQQGKLRNYLLIILISLIVWLVATATTHTNSSQYTLTTHFPRITPVDIYATFLASLILIAAMSVALVPRRFPAIAALSLAGFGVSMLYANFGAPDLALTQICIEALSLVLLLLAFRRLPDIRLLASRATRWRDAAIAACCGGVIATLVYVATGVDADDSLTRALSTRSLPEGFGKNVVNVILVDFRALDTLGEITVIGVAALGVYALMKPSLSDPAAHIRIVASREHSNSCDDVAPPQSLPLTRPQTRPLSPPETTSVSPIFPLATTILQSTARVLAPIIFLFAIIVMFQGHNKPGGGFIGGLIASTAVALYALAFGNAAAKRLLRIDARTLIGVGLLAALSSAFISPILGGPFMAPKWTSITIPTLEPIKLGTPTLFDVGVFLLVLGVISQFVVSLLGPLVITPVRARPHTDLHQNQKPHKQTRRAQ